MNQVSRGWNEVDNEVGAAENMQRLPAQHLLDMAAQPTQLDPSAEPSLADVMALQEQVLQRTTTLRSDMAEVHTTLDALAAASADTASALPAQLATLAAKLTELTACVAT